MATSLLAVVATIAFTHLLPNFLAPVISLIFAGVLYSFAYTIKSEHSSSCSLMVYSFYIILIIYSCVIILLNLLHYFDLIDVGRKFMYFDSKTFIPTLIFMPVGFVSLIAIYLRNNELAVCKDCKIIRGDIYARGKLGIILNKESHYQLKNLIFLFGIISIIEWSYYLLLFYDSNINGRDKYVFFWIAIICFISDEIYFIFRYYNLYMDLNDNDEILTDQDMERMHNFIYLRVYIICKNNVYILPDAPSLDNPEVKVLDTPLFTKVPAFELRDENSVKRFIESQIGYDKGELKFYFRQVNHDANNGQRIDRYFYFIDDENGICPALKIDGQWIDYDIIQHIYSTHPTKLAPLSISDTTRLATIILTEKMFKENGQRKNKLKRYRPTFNLYDVRNSSLDFQDDKWLHVAMFNSDVKLYRLKKLLYRFMGKKPKIRQF